MLSADEQIRIAAIQAAATASGHRPEMTSRDTLRTAETFEHYIRTGERVDGPRTQPIR